MTKQTCLVYGDSQIETVGAERNDADPEFSRSLPELGGVNAAKSIGLYEAAPKNVISDFSFQLLRPILTR